MVADELDPGEDPLYPKRVSTLTDMRLAVSGSAPNSAVRANGEGAGSVVFLRLNVAAIAAARASAACRVRLRLKS